MIEFDLSTEDFEEYAEAYLSAGGFSKGTANVSAKDYSKLRPLLKHYAKKPHPFRTCVKDNRKRFDPLTEKYCAVLKDLIYHSTAWRNKKKEKGMKAKLDQTEFAGLDWPEESFVALADFVDWADESMIADIIEHDTEELDLAQLNVAPLRRLDDVQEGLLEYIGVETDGDDKMEAQSLLQRVMSLIGKLKAEAAAGGRITYSPPDSVAPAGYSLNQAAQLILSDNRPFAAEMMLEDEAGEVDDESGLVWKTIMREGKWKFSPADGESKRPKGMSVIPHGKSDPDNMVISMAELVKNFEAGAIEHVTIPTSHENKVHENTGFIRELRKSRDPEGNWILEAAMDFTEPDIKGKATRGSIANTSAGILFGYRRKEDGKRFNSVLEHAALTNKPWLNGMTPFGVAASQEGGMTVMFSEDDSTEGGEIEFEDDFSNEELEAVMEQVEDAGAAAEDGADVELADKKPNKPYGNVTYADPGYQDDGKARYPVDTEKHVRAAWSYINKATNAAHYSQGQLKKVKSRIRSAMKRVGAQIDMSDEQLTVENETALRALLAQEVTSTTTNSEGGASTVEDKDKKEEAKTPEEIVAETLGLSVEEVKAMQEENARLKAEAEGADLDAQLAKWAEEKKSPALLAVAETVLKGEASAKGVSLSEDGKTVELNLAEVVARLVDASPVVNLDEEQVTDEEQSKDGKPKDSDEGAELSDEVMARARRLFLDEGKSEDEAIAIAKAEFEAKA